MTASPHRWAATLLALMIPLSASAALHVRPGGMVYDSHTDLTWLLDWNTAAGTAFDDGSSRTDGRMSWASAVAWADALRWGGVDDWRLPNSDACFGFGCRGSEMGKLWYESLGLSGGQGTGNAAPFLNVNPAPYWTATLLVGGTQQAWYFNALGGSQNALPLTAQAHAVAVRRGDVVSSVPEPSSMWLTMTGLIMACGSAVRARAQR